MQITQQFFFFFVVVFNHVDSKAVQGTCTLLFTEYRKECVYVHKFRVANA